MGRALKDKKFKNKKGPRNKWIENQKSRSKVIYKTNLTEFFSKLFSYASRRRLNFETKSGAVVTTSLSLSCRFNTAWIIPNKIKDLNWIVLARLSKTFERKQLTRLLLFF